MLLPQAGWGRVGGGDTVAFMPHFESAERGAWVEAAAAAGIELIDPRGDPAAIIAAIGRCRVLLSEAMHGVDRCRCAARAVDRGSAAGAGQHRAKWHDWADTLDLHVEFHRLAPSSLRERLRASPLAALHSGYRLLDRFGSSVWAPDARSAHRAGGAVPGRRRRRPPQLSAAAGTGPLPVRGCWSGWTRCGAIPDNLPPCQPCYTSAYHG